MKKVVKKKAAPRPVARKKGKGMGKSWTAAEVKMLKTMFKTTTSTVIAKRLKRSLSSVRSKAVAMSLRKGRKPAAKKAAPKGKVVRKAAPMKKRGRRC